MIDVRITKKNAPKTRAAAVSSSSGAAGSIDTTELVMSWIRSWLVPVDAAGNELERSGAGEIAALKAKYPLFSESEISAFGLQEPTAGSGSGVGINEADLAQFLTANGYATQSWVNNQGFLTGHQSLAAYLTIAAAADTYQPKGNYLTAHQSLAAYLKSADAADTYQPKGNYATTTALSTHTGNTTVHITSAERTAWNAKLDASTFSDLFEKVNKGTSANPIWVIRAKYGLYSDEELSAFGFQSGSTGSGSGVGINEADLANFLTTNGYATQAWVNDKNFLTAHQSLAAYLTKTAAADTYQPKGNYLTAHQSLAAYLKSADAADTYQPKGNYLTAHQSLAAYLKSADAADTYQPKGSYATTTALSNHTGNTTVHITAAERTAWNAKLDASTFSDLFEKVNKGTTANPIWVIRAKYGLYSDEEISAFGFQNGSAGSGSGVGINEADLAQFLTANGYATQAWVNNQGFLTGHQSLAAYLTKTAAADTYQPKGNYLTSHQSLAAYLTIAAAADTYQPKGNYLTSHQSLAAYLKSADAADTYQPKGNYATTTALSTHTGNTTVHITAAERTAWNAKLDASTFSDLFEKVNKGTSANPIWVIRAKYGLYSDEEISAFGFQSGSAGSGSGVGINEADLANFLTTNGYATQAWVNDKNFLTAHQSLAAYLTKTAAADTYQPKGNYLTAHQSLAAYLKSADAADTYQPKGNFVTTDTEQTITADKAITGIWTLKNSTVRTSTAISIGSNIGDETYDKYHRIDLGYHSYDRINVYEKAVNFFTLGGENPHTVINSTSLTAPKFVKTNGTAAQFLKADGSVDSTTYLAASVFNELFEKTTKDGKTVIRAKYGLYSDAELSAFGFQNGSTATGGVGINEADLANFLTTNGYATQAWVEAKKYLTALPSHSHNFIDSKGLLSPQTGRTQALGGLYTYNTMTGQTGAPTTYTSILGFGRGDMGTVEIAGGWTSSMGLWYRALRDTTDNWYAWRKLLDSVNTKIENGVITINGTTITPLTAHQSLAAYLKSADAANTYLPLTGGTLTGKLTLPLLTIAGSNYTVGCDPNTYFGPSIASTGAITCGRTDARWATVYTKDANLTGKIAINYATAGSASLVCGLASSLAAGQYVQLAVGKKNSNFNRANFLYFHVADDSDKNYMGLGLYGADKALNILGNKRVGIGTTDPAQLLDVNGDAICSSMLTRIGLRFYKATGKSHYLEVNDSAAFNLCASNNGSYDHIAFSVDWDGNATAAKFKKSGGTATQFLKADGSVDSTAYLAASAFSELFEKTTKDGKTVIRAKYGLYSDAELSAFGFQSGSAGSGSGVGINEADLAQFLTTNGYATQAWVNGKNYLTAHQSLADYLKKTDAANTYLAKTANAASATKLQTARKIWGQSFDGSANTCGDLRLYPTGDWADNVSSPKLIFASNDSRTNDPYIQAIFAAGNGYGRKRLGFFMHKADSWDGAQFEALSIKQDGKVGIGTTDPAQLLDVNGDAICNTIYLRYGLRFQKASGKSHYIEVNAAGAFNLCATNNGSFDHIPLAVDWDGNATVYGNLLARGEVTALTASDARLKTNILPLRQAVRRLRALGGYRVYDYRPEAGTPDRTARIGLIAQQAQGNVADRMTHRRPDGMLALNYLHPDYINLIGAATLETADELRKAKEEIKLLKQRLALLFK